MNEETRDYLLTYVFGDIIGGKEFKSEKKFQTFKNAKEEYKRIFSIIRLAFTSTVKVIDHHHYKKILDTITHHEKQINYATNFNKLDQSMIAFQTNLIFLLLGFFPRRRLMLNTRIPLQKDYWTLSCFREVQFIQSNTQKVAVILDYCRTEEYTSVFDDDPETEIYINQFKKNDALFIQWFKENRTKIYLELF